MSFALFPSRQVLLEIGSLSIHWYGVMYLVAFLLGYVLVQKIQHHRELPFSKDDWSELLTSIIVGVLLGGRLGYVLLYEPGYYLSNPIDILAVWKGGMSSHGGFVGVILALILWVRQSPVSVLKVGDIIVIPVAIGFALGRFGNFINLELYGTVTALPWGMAFPGVEGLRHPVQLYAVITNLLIAGVCYWHLRTPESKPGRTGALFVTLYALQRLVLELLREPTHAPVEIVGASFTRGQLFSIPLLFFGVILWLLVPRLLQRR